MKSFSIIALFCIIFQLLLVPPTPCAEQNQQIITITKGAYDKLAALFTNAVSTNPVYLILVEKKLQRLSVLEYTDALRIAAVFPCATGENTGQKKSSGDAKTPEGVYFITRIYHDDKITIFGDRAFHLDYPNIFDKEAGRNGDGIYIHGTNRKLTPNSTNGCITLTNSDLSALTDYLTQVVTPVVIVNELAEIDQSKSQLLQEQDFSLAKSLLLPDRIKADNVEYDYLYTINYGQKAVAVSNFRYHPFKRSTMRGASRSYLKYLPHKGWTSLKRIQHISPLQIFPEIPGKVAVGTSPSEVPGSAIDITANSDAVVPPSSRHLSRIDIVREKN